MKYLNKNEAVRDMVKSMFSAIPVNLIAASCSNLYDRWEIKGKLDEDDDDDEVYGYVGLPMWGWVWLADDSFMERFIDEHREEVMDLGFTILEEPENGWLCLGIDGAGFDFYGAFWEPLYDLAGFRWHEKK